MKNLLRMTLSILVFSTPHHKKTLFALLFLWPFIGITQQQVAKEIQALQNRGDDFQKVELVNYESQDLSRNSGFSGLKKGTLLRLNHAAISQLESNHPPLITLKLPIDERSELTLLLKEQKLFTEDFKVFTSDKPGQPFSYTAGKHYYGIIEGDPGSIVAISIFENEINGLICTHEGNFVFGKVKDSKENLHILYNDVDIEDKNIWECGTLEDGMGYTHDQLSYQGGQRDPGDCIRVYIEIDDNIVTDMGGAANALNFITSIFNQTITLYANESITMSVSEILVWTTTSPYNGNTGGEMLTSYQNNTGTFNGDLSHLVSFQPSGQGVAAGFNGICNSNPDLSKCFSGIFPVYSVFPAWSWSVNVTAHEMGHLIGSRHTHACVWNFNNTAIDGCAGNVEGNCPLPGIPSGGGTIMSYCHNTNVGVKFNLGFGSQPGNVIRNAVNVLGNCLSSSCTPAPEEYCWAAGGQGQPGHASWIQSVSLGSINNTSGNNLGYADYTTQSTTLNVDSTYTIVMTIQNQGSNFHKTWGVYIDYNHDNDFYDAGEFVTGGGTAGALSVSFTFTVPSASPEVTTRMRVVFRRTDSGATIPCGYNTAGEVEDYTVNIVSNGPTCSDNAQNGDETGVDCGGATCPVCPSCTDGLQNGDEEGIDCGGGCGNECPGSLLFGHYFESGWNGWTDGGVDAARYSGSNSWEGNYSINLQDNDGEQSAMTSPVVNLTGFTSVQLDFYFKANSMENGEDFLVKYFNGTTYSTVATFAAGYGGNFSNNTFWIATVILTSSQVNFASNARFKIQCDAGDNNDDIYVDAITLTGYNATALMNPGQWLKAASPQEVISQKDEEMITLFPNPVSNEINVLNINDEVLGDVTIFDAYGKRILQRSVSGSQISIDVTNLSPGIYFLRNGQFNMLKFVKE